MAESRGYLDRIHCTGDPDTRGNMYFNGRKNVHGRHTLVSDELASGGHVAGEDLGVLSADVLQDLEGRGGLEQRLGDTRQRGGKPWTAILVFSLYSQPPAALLSPPPPFSFPSLPGNNYGRPAAPQRP